MNNVKEGNHGFRRTPAFFKDIDSQIVTSLLEVEINSYSKFRKSYTENIDSSRHIPLGVHSSFQYYDPFPISISHSEGAYLYDIEGNRFLDLSMGFGAMMVGHRNKFIESELTSALHEGTLYTAPSARSKLASIKLKERFNLDFIRFANSGTEANMYAVRLARVATGKMGVLKIEGGYHGGPDTLNFSTKPLIKDAGSPSQPNVVPAKGIATSDFYVVPFNNLDSLEYTLKSYGDKIACFILEPVLENIGIVLPDDGYLSSVRSLCDKYNIILIFDEVKTGLTAGYAGAGNRMGVKADITTLAKSIGAGLPVAAFGGDKRFSKYIEDGQLSHFGTYNGHNLGAAAVLAVDKLSTIENISNSENLNFEALGKISDIIEEYQLPAHTVGFGIKGAVTWRGREVRNYRDYKDINFDLAKLSFFWSLNRGIITPPGLDEQWLVSFAHEKAEIDILINDFHSLARALRGL